MSSSESLQQLLSELSQAGTLDSTGAFTIDLDRSVEKLSQFQLEDPRSYVHCIVSAALTKGASFIQFDVSSRNVLAGFDGPPFTRDEFADIFEALFNAKQDKDSRALHHLAFGMNVSRQIGGLFVTVDSWDRNVQIGARVQITNGLLQVGPLTSAPWNDPLLVTRFHMREPFDPDYLLRITDGIARRLVGTPQTWPELEYLEGGRCGFCPIQIWANGKLVQPDLDAYLACFKSESDTRRPAAMPTSIPETVDSWSGGVGLHRGKPGCIYWVLDGLAYREAHERTLPPEVAVWCYADELKTDVSKGFLNQGNELTERRRQVHETMQRVLPELQRKVLENPRAKGKFRKFAQHVIPG